MNPIVVGHAAFWLAACLLMANPALATTPKLPGVPAPPAQASLAKAEPAAPASDAALDRLRQKLADAKEQLDLATAREAAASSSDVATAEEIVESQLLLRQLVWVYQRQIDTLTKASSLRQSRAALEREAAEWTGFPTPPPYSFVMVDGLREAARFQQVRVNALEAINAAIDQEAQRRKDMLDEISGKLRQANEKLEGKGSASPRLVWQRDLVALRNRLAEARVEGFQIEQQANQEELEEARLRLDFVQRQLSEAKHKIAYPAEDKVSVRNRMVEERKSLQAEMDAATPVADAARSALEAATAEQAQQKGGGDPAVRAEQLDRLELEREQAENAILKLQALNRLFDSAKLRENIWELRWAVGGTDDAEEARQAYAKIDDLKLELKPVKEYLQQSLKLVSAQILGIEMQLLDPSAARSTAQLQSLYAIYGERAKTYQRMLRGVERTEHRLDLWKQDLDDRRQTATLAERAAEWSAQAHDLGYAAWAFELFAVEDSIVVEGQTITGKRSVTLGKVLSALLILVVGLWLSAKLSRLAERVAVNRAGMDASAARIARRWLLFLIGLMLLMISMVMVKIPLTVFAFTGGALAIGAGFGMQNLLKNLISGMMLLWERPFKPGDLVEVSGIRGRVIDIGMRSSHIRDGNGIETVIPNSNFIEENVTNWTLSSQSVRIVVKLGVAYDTPVQDLTDLLLEVADRHGLVQDKPPPEVLFEDFGADALQFGLYVWVEIKPGVDWRAITSDLRFMIHKTLAAHGIVMSFPQRDIHLDAAQPLAVRLITPAQE